MTVVAARGGPVLDLLTPEDHAIKDEIFQEDVYRLAGRDLAGRSVVDVGACFGAFTLAAVEAGARVWAVEPHPANTVRLCEHLTMNEGGDAVCIVDAAVYRLSGGHVCTVHGSGGSGWTDGTLPTSAEDGVPSVTLDEVLNEASEADPHGRVAMLKLDCEGAEWDALCPSTLLHLVDFVACEWHGPALTERPDLGTVGQLVDALSPTHGCEVFGHPERGGQLYATRYPIPEADE